MNNPNPIPPYPTTIDPTQDGISTCLFHRQWEWSMTYIVPTMPRCPYCNGIANPRIGYHHLCAARAKLNIKFTPLDCTPKCPCKACNP